MEIQGKKQKKQSGTGQVRIGDVIQKLRQTDIRSQAESCSPQGPRVGLFPHERQDVEQGAEEKGHNEAGAAQGDDEDQYLLEGTALKERFSHGGEGKNRGMLVQDRMDCKSTHRRSRDRLMVPRANGRGRKSEDMEGTKGFDALDLGENRDLIRIVW